MKRVLSVIGCAALLVSCGGPGKSQSEEPPEGDTKFVNLTKEVRLGQGNIFYKEISNITMDTILVEIEASERFQRLFDMNVIEKNSFDVYDSTHNKSDLILIHTLRDLTALDTAIEIPPGTYLLALQNYANADTIGINVSFTFPD